MSRMAFDEERSSEYEISCHQRQEKKKGSLGSTQTYEKETYSSLRGERGV